MASQTTVTLLDDIDGKKADETVSFALDAASYEIDLSKKNATALRKALAEYVAVARPVRAVAGSVAPGARRRRSAGIGSHKAELTEIRIWAKQAGIHVAERGRISADVQEQYRAAHS